MPPRSPPYTALAGSDANSDGHSDVIEGNPRRKRPEYQVAARDGALVRRSGSLR